MKRIYLLLGLLAAGAALVAYTQKPEEENPVKELEDFNPSERIGVDTSVPFPVDI